MSSFRISFSIQNKCRLRLLLLVFLATLFSASSFSSVMNTLPRRSTIVSKVTMTTRDLRRHVVAASLEEMDSYYSAPSDNDNRDFPYKEDDDDITYQTNLEIARLASMAPRNSSCAGLALKLLRGLEHPDTVTYNGVLKAYAKSSSSSTQSHCQYAEQAEAILREMQQLHQTQVARNQEWYQWNHHGFLTEQDLQQGPPRITVTPNVRSYSTVMDAWSRGKSVESAQRAQDLLNELIDARRTQLRQDDDTKTTAKRDSTLADVGSFPIPPPNAVSYNTVITAWAKSGGGLQAAQASQALLDSMIPKGLPDVISYNAVLSAWARSGIPEAGPYAEALMRSMPTHGPLRPNAITYSTVLDAWSRSCQLPGSASRAWQLLQEMEQHYQDTKDESIRPNGVSYSSVIHAYALSKEPNKAAMAWKIFRRMRHLYESGENTLAKPTLVTYNSVLNACATCCTTSDTHLAPRMMIGLYRELLASPELQPDHFTYGTVLKACANLLCGEPDSPEFVKKVFEQCCRDGQVSFGVCYQLRQAATSELYRSLIPPQAYNPTNGHFSIKDMPKEWTKNVRERRKTYE